MARRKNKKSFFTFGKGKKLTKAQKKERSQAVKTTMAIFVFIIVMVAVVVGFVFLERYVNNRLHTSEKIGKLELVDVPAWAGEELKTRIIATASNNADDFRLAPGTAAKIGSRLEDMAWLADVKVQIGAEAIIVNARYRKPVALIRASGRQFFVDDEMVVLDYVPMEKLAIVEITGLPSHVLTNRYLGSKWARDDLAAAIELIDLLSRMDAEITPNAPLLFEIQSIDMSNYNGRRSSRQPHIVLYAKDGTEIRWGAEKGTWHKHLEARDEEKLTVLYNTYEQMGTLQLKSNHKASFIDLTRPQSLALPIDSY